LIKRKDVEIIEPVEVDEHGFRVARPTKQPGARHVMIVAGKLCDDTPTLALKFPAEFVEMRTCHFCLTSQLTRRGD
jgi:hypothetical protein